MTSTFDLTLTDKANLTPSATPKLPLPITNRIDAPNSVVTNRECCHCAANHPELCVSFVELDFGYDPAALSDEDRAFADKHGALYAAKTAEWESAGYPSAAIDHLSAEHVEPLPTAPGPSMSCSCTRRARPPTTSSAPNSRRWRSACQACEFSTCRNRWAASPNGPALSDG